MSTEQRLGNEVQIKCKELIEILEEEVDYKPELHTVIEILQSLSKKYKLENFEMELIESSLYFEECSESTTLFAEQFDRITNSRD